MIDWDDGSDPEPQWVEGAVMIGSAFIGAMMLFVIFMTVACTPAEPDPYPNGVDLSAGRKPAAVEHPRFDPAAIEAMRRQLLAEPKIHDVLFQPGRLEVEWQVAVADDGTPRTGYAGYICQLLRAKGLVDDDTDVRIVDQASARQSGGNFRSISLGSVNCYTGADRGA